jgi:membrane protein DedA with SNARE-associated domain
MSMSTMAVMVRSWFQDTQTTQTNYKCLSNCNLWIVRHGNFVIVNREFLYFLLSLNSIPAVQSRIGKIQTVYWN